VMGQKRVRGGTLRRGERSRGEEIWRLETFFSLFEREKEEKKEEVERKNADVDIFFFFLSFSSSSFFAVRS